MCKPTTLISEVDMSNKNSNDSTNNELHPSPPLLSISKAELARHNSPQSAWCAIHSTRHTDPLFSSGRHLPPLVLDITEFASRHPGGDVIFLAAGKDASVLLETYHPRGVPQTLIQKLQVGVLEETVDQRSGSYYSWDSDFYRVLKKRVVQRLEERGLSRRGSCEIWVKAVVLLIGFWTCLFQMVLSKNYSLAVVYSVGMGCFAAFVGTCIQHDGNHGAFANKRVWNKMAGWTLDMIGASAFTWEVQHVLGHHPYTNVLDVVEEERKGNTAVRCATGVDCPLSEKDQESDPDVFSSFPLMRMHPLHTPSWYHKYQHIYAPLLFALMTLGKVFQQDFEVATSKRLYHIDAHGRYGSLWNVVRFWFMKFLTLGYMLGLPIYYHGFSKGLSLFLVGHLVCGELLATMFIVNHVIEGVSYAAKDLKSSEKQRAGKKNGSLTEHVYKPSTITGDTPMEKTRKEANEKYGKNTIPFVPFNDWAAVQCQTSVNWSPGSWFWNHFSGGLSHQIEHHLFPSICHTNYCYIQDVVQSTCEEYGVPYQSESSLWMAYWKMLRHLKVLGRIKSD